MLFVIVTLVAGGIFLGSAGWSNLFINCVFAALAASCWGAAVGALFGLARRGAVIGALLILLLVACAFVLAALTARFSGTAPLSA
jgi:hypothetical protein